MLLAECQHWKRRPMRPGSCSSTDIGWVCCSQHQLSMRTNRHWFHDGSCTLAHVVRTAVSLINLLYACIGSAAHCPSHCRGCIFTYCRDTIYPSSGILAHNWRHCICMPRADILTTLVLCQQVTSAERQQSCAGSAVHSAILALFLDCVCVLFCVLCSQGLTCRCRGYDCSFALTEGSPTCSREAYRPLAAAAPYVAGGGSASKGGGSMSRLCWGVVVLLIACAIQTQQWRLGPCFGACALAAAGVVYVKHACVLVVAGDP
jgi:hypothetical protein